MEKAALIIIDMVKDYFIEDKSYPITPLGPGDNSFYQPDDCSV